MWYNYVTHTPARAHQPLALYYNVQTRNKLIYEIEFVPLSTRMYFNCTHTVVVALATCLTCNIVANPKQHTLHKHSIARCACYFPRFLFFSFFFLFIFFFFFFSFLFLPLYTRDLRISMEIHFSHFRVTTTQKWSWKGLTARTASSLSLSRKDPSRKNGKQDSFGLFIKLMTNNSIIVSFNKIKLKLSIINIYFVFYLSIIYRNWLMIKEKRIIPLNLFK